MEVPGVLPLIVTGDAPNEQLGAGVPPLIMLHERLTLPV
jgi:hypothetical protein